MAKDATSQAQAIAGLDIGTTKVTCAIGRFENGRLNIIGVGTAPNSGMRHGVVVNIDATSEAIKKAKDEAELMAGQKIENVWLAVGGQHIQSFASSGMVAIRNKEVQQDDIERVIEAAKAVAIPHRRTSRYLRSDRYVGRSFGSKRLYYHGLDFCDPKRGEVRAARGS
jgi:cell division protein FtsA